MPDPGAMRLFWYLFAGTRGGATRIEIIMRLRDKPSNRNQLAEAMRLDYKSIQHHLGVLEKNNLIRRQGEKYGIMFFISSYLEVNAGAFDEICKKLEKSK